MSYGPIQSVGKYERQPKSSPQNLKIDAYSLLKSYAAVALTSLNVTLKDVLFDDVPWNISAIYGDNSDLHSLL